jgi:nucleotide-binding universal stress UspA family protein
MSTTTKQTEAQAGIGEVAGRQGPILVASDGREASLAAFTTARLLAERGRTDVEVVSVLEPLNVIAPPLDEPEPHVHPGTSRVRERRDRLAELERQARGADAGWPTEIALGSTVPSIARIARERSARLVVTGHVHHGVVERVVRGETPLGVVRAGRVPVLAVPEAMTRLPRCVVVAVEHGSAAAALAPMARMLFSDAVEVHLVHVRPPALALYERERREEDDAYVHAMERSFASARRGWALPADVSVTTHVRVGRPADGLSEYADAVGADLLVVGIAVHAASPHFPGRELAVRLFHGSPRAMLLVPVEARPGTHVGETTTTSTDPRDWGLLLALFTRRNARRLVSLAVDEPGLGMRFVARRQPLVGVEYDEREHAAYVVLAPADDTAPHLTHRVARPVALAAYRRGDDGDEALVIGHPDGQAVLTVGSTTHDR